MIWSLRLAAIGLCLASISFAQTDSSNRTPNLHLLYTSDAKLNQNFMRLDEVLGPIGKAFDPTTNPKGTRIGYDPVCDCFGFFDAARSPIYDFDIVKNDPAGLVFNLWNTSATGQTGIQLRGPNFNFLTLVTGDGQTGYTLGMGGSPAVGTETFTISNRNVSNPNILVREPDGAVQLSNDLYADTAGAGHQPTDILRLYGSKGQNTTGTTGQLAGFGIQAQLKGGDGGNAPAGSTNGSGGYGAVIGGDAGSGAGTSGTPGNAIVNAGNNARGAAGKAYVIGGNSTGVPGGNVVLQGGTGSTPGVIQALSPLQATANVQIGATITAQTATIHTILYVQTAFTFPSLTAPNCQDSAAIATTGAILGDGVIVGLPTGAVASIGATFNAYVSVADQLKVRECCTVGTCTIGSQTYNLWVIH